MATVTKPIALDESLNTTEATPRNIADVLAEEIGNLVSVVSRIAPQTVYDLDDLGDVDITSPSNGQVLKYNGTSQKWENGTGGGSGDSVSWSQIQQSGTKIAEIEINGVTTDVYAPTGGGGFSALIIITADAGQTVTATKDGDTYTATEVTSGTYEVTVDSAGTWTISDGTISDTIAIPSSGTYYITLSSVPDGKTVTPTDDVQILLACAGITDKSYTTLTELFADTTTLASVIADNNAIDYLKRSTSFAKSEALVPVMTDNTHPSGEAFASVSYSTNLPYKAFDNDTSTYWNTASNSNEYVGYTFPSAKIVTGISLLPDFTGTSTYNKVKNFKVQGSNDGFVSDINDLYEGTAESTNSPTVQRFNFGNSTAYTSYRLFIIDAYSTANIGVISLQFYNVEEGFTDNATAMSYIGLNNYASNTLLADSTWCSAICNSTYFESVLNVKVPTMTSNTTPSGVCSANAEFSTSYQAYKAFDNDSTTSWTPGTVTSTNPNTGWIQYDFGTTKVCNMVKAKAWTGDDIWTSVIVSGSNDNSNFTPLFESTEPISALNPSEHIFTFGNNTAYRYYRLTITSYRNGGTTGNYTEPIISEMQFYGRADI